MIVLNYCTYMTIKFNCKKRKQLFKIKIFNVEISSGSYTLCNRQQYCVTLAQYCFSGKCANFSETYFKECRKKFHLVATHELLSYR